MLLKMHRDFFLNGRIGDVTAIPCQQKINPVQGRDRDMNCVRPAGSDKGSTTIRFDRDVLAAFRAAGPGWQTRMNAALVDWLKNHSPA